MIDQLKDVVTQFTQKEVEGNAGIDNQLAGSVAQETGSSILEGLKSAVSGGNISDVMSLAGNLDVNSLSSNPVVKNIIESLSSNLTNKVGIDGATSSGFAGNIIPQILSSVLGGKSGGFNITDILGSLTGGDGNPLDQNKDGKIGFDDAIAAVKNGNIGDILGDMFKK